MKKYIKLLRVKNYIKNILVFLPAVFSKQLFNADVIPILLFGFLSYCALSSSVYVLNDLCDAERDRSHPIKRNRPIANGSVGTKSAILLIVFLFALSLVFNYLACGKNAVAFLLLLVYLVQNILYSFKLKHMPVLDVGILALGFLIRVFYGSAILGVEISNWLYLTVIAISFYIGFGKRRNELALLEGCETRSVLNHYTYDFLDKNMYVCSALTIVFYSLWSIDSATISNFGGNAVVWTIPLVILICISYSLAVEKCTADDPIDVIFESKLLFVLVAVYAISMLGIIYITDIKELFFSLTNN